MVMVDPTPVETPPVDVMPPDPFMESTDIPRPDTPYTYTGEGVQPTWGDVYSAAEAQYTKDALLPQQDPNDATVKWVMRADRVAIGSALKAMSGFINRVSQEAVAGDNAVLSTVSQITFNLIGTIGAIVVRLETLERFADFVDKFTIPNLQAQITQNLAKAFTFALAAQQNAEAYARNDVFLPLYAEVLKVQPAIDASAHQVTQTAHADTQLQVATLAAAVGTVVTGLRTQIAALQAENDNCTKPMCETMGPNTSLGKFLKGLNLAADAALIAELLALNENDLANLIRQVVAKLAGVVNDFEQFETSGSETVAGLIKAAGGTLT